MHNTVKKALMLAKNRRKYASGGVPDDASQEAFLQEQLEGSAPQYEPQAENLAQGIAQGAATLTPPGAIADAAGYLGGPSALQNLKNQNYIDAALQLAAVVPGVGPLKTASKASREAQKLANAEHFIEWVDPSMKAGRRYKTEKQAIKSKPPGAKLVHTTIEDPVRYNNPIKKADGGDVNFGRPDEASQEAFLQEQLQGSAPQYMPEEGMLTGKRAGLMAAGFAPGAGIATAAGQFPTAEGGKEPSMAEDLRKGEYLSAGLKGLGAAGDIAYGVPLVGPAVGAAMKAPLVAKLAVAAAPMAKIAGEVAPATEAISRVTNPIGMHSAAAEAARALPQEKGTLQQMLATMKGVTPEELHWSGVHEAFAGKPTVTREELAKHFEERLPGVSETVLGSIPSEKMASLREEYARIEHGDTYQNLPSENKRRIDDLIMERRSTSKYHNYQIPGGENYREVVLHLPNKEKRNYAFEWFNPENQTSKMFASEEEAINNAPEGAVVVKVEKSIENPIFKSSHWDQPNVLSHLRMSDRTGPEGEKILHLEELQSDWGQKGRKEGFVQNLSPELKAEEEALNKEYNFLSEKHGGISGLLKKVSEKDPEAIQDRARRQELLPRMREIAGMRGEILTANYGQKIAVPRAPYVASPEGKHTLSWVDLGLKRALKEAAEGGYDKLIWTPGEEHVQRYNLRNHFNNISYDPEEKTLSFVRHGSHDWENVPGNIEKDQIAEHIGVDAAERLLNTKPNPLSGNHILEGEDLEVGGDGMKKFYDKIVPSQLQKIVKKLDKDAKVQLGGYQLTKDQQNVPVNAHVIQITPKMREAILKGFSAYAAGGAVKPRDSSHLAPIIQRGMTAVKRAKSQNGGSKMMINRKMYEPMRGVKVKFPPEELSDEPDIRSYQLKRHSHEFIGSPEPEAPKRSVYLDAPLFGVRKKLFDMPYYYQPAVQKALNFAYGQKTTPFYLFEPTAPLARAIDAYETTKFIQRDPKSFSSYTGIPGTLMGITKMGVPAVASGAYLAGDGESEAPQDTKKVPAFDFGETFNVISHPKTSPELLKEEDFMKYAKGGSVDDEFHELMAEVDKILEEFKE